MREKKRKELPPMSDKLVEKYSPEVDKIRARVREIAVNNDVDNLDWLIYKGSDAGVKVEYDLSSEEAIDYFVESVLVDFGSIHIGGYRLINTDIFTSRSEYRYLDFNAITSATYDAFLVEMGAEESPGIRMRVVEREQREVEYKKKYGRIYIPEGAKSQKIYDDLRSLREKVYNDYTNESYFGTGWRGIYYHPAYPIVLISIVVFIMLVSVAMGNETDTPFEKALIWIAFVCVVLFFEVLIRGKRYEKAEKRHEHWRRLHGFYDVDE